MVEMIRRVAKRRDSSRRVDDYLVIYHLAMAVAAPIARWWGRMQVSGVDLIPRTGPVLVLVNHDSQWDPVVIGVAAVRRRQIRALAISTLWQKKLLAWVLDGMGQIPVSRGAGDDHAMDEATRRLKSGTCLGVFPEATVSLGRTMRARSGAGRLALAVPEARIICAAVTGTVDVAKFPKRPSIRVEFFEPASGQHLPGETAAEFSARMLAEIRERAPIAKTRKADKVGRQLSA